MAQEDLIPFNELTQEEHKKIATKGGQASVQARKQKKQVKDVLKALLELKPSEKDISKIKKDYPNVDFKTIEEVLNFAMLNQARIGNVQAYNAIYDRVEGKPVQKAEIETKQLPNDKETLFAELRQVAELEGLTIEQFCLKEGIDLENNG
jgi:Tfp pilus assembly protein PilO